MHSLKPLPAKTNISKKNSTRKSKNEFEADIINALQDQKETESQDY